MRCKTIQLLIDIIRGKAIIIGLNKLKVYSKLKNKKNIPVVKVIGDSHVSFFAGHDDITFKHFEFEINNGCDKLENFITFHVGPALAYNLNRYGSNTKAREKTEYLLKKNYIKSGDTVLLCFGCIDTSVHVIKHAKSEKYNDYDEGIKCVCNDIINNYLKFAQELKAKNINVFLWGALPQCLQEETKELGIEINKEVKIFNSLLEQKAKESGITVLSVYEKLINDDYSSKKEYYSDAAHLNQKAWEFARDEIRKIDILKDVVFEEKNG